jgi:predicted porin
MKTTSRLALLAAAGLLLGAVTPATAADLKGGGCCADLEERVAELEATTARKGNRVVSLQVYGQVNKALLIWDDGVDSDAFIVDNEGSGSRIGLTGKATIKPGWSAGFLMEFDYQDSSSDRVVNIRGGDDGREGRTDDSEIVIRHNNLWIESERLGRITLGQGSTAADGAAGVNLSNSLRGPASDHGSNFDVRDSGGGRGPKLDSFVFDLDGPREDVIRYDSPSIYGFIVSASWGDDDYADVALRFKKEFNSVRVAAAISYAWDERAAFGDTSPDEINTLVGSASAMHVPTGLYVAFAAGTQENDDSNFERNYWYIQGGIEKKWTPYGATTVYAEYGSYDSDGAEFGDEEFASDLEATRWGFGVVQKFDSAAMEVYAQATFYEFEAAEVDDIEDISTIMIGSRIKF